MDWYKIATDETLEFLKQIEKRNIVYDLLMIIFLILLFLPFLLTNISNINLEYLTLGTFTFVFAGIMYEIMRRYWYMKSIGDRIPKYIRFEDNYVTIRCSQTKKIPYQDFIDSLVNIGAIKASHPKSKNFKFPEFLSNGNTYITEEFKKHPPKSNIILGVTIMNNRNFPVKVILDMYMDFSIVNLNIFNCMLNEWREKYEAYLKRLGKMKR